MSMEDMRLSPPSSSAFLTPESAIPRERRLSTSSMDSSVSQMSSCSRLKRSKRSSSRLSEFDDENDDVTILSFLQSGRNFLLRSCATSKKILVTLRKVKPRPKLVCEGEILEQTNMICRDYVMYKLCTKDLVTRKPPLTPANWPKSTPVIDACITLEHAYPRIYSNVSRKLCMTMTSTKVVRAALNSVLDVLFEGPTTWGKMVSMFSLCALFSEECVAQGHAEFVTDVVDAVVDFTNSRLLEWLVSQGGWDCFPCPKEEEGLCDSFGRVFAATFAVTFILMVLLVVVHLDWTVTTTTRQEEKLQ